MLMYLKITISSNGNYRMEKMSVRIRQYTISTDIYHFFIVALLITSCTLISTFVFSRSSTASGSLIFLLPVLFLLPVVWTAFFITKHGIPIAIICGIAYFSIEYYFVFYNSAELTIFFLEAALFILVASVIAHAIEQPRKREMQYKSVFKNAHHGYILINNRNFTIRQTNSAFPDMLQYKPEEMKTMNFSDLFLNSEDKSFFLKQINQDAHTAGFETRFATKNGRGCWVVLSWSPLGNNTSCCTVINIDARKIAESADCEDLIKYRELAENSVISMLVVRNGKILYTNPAFCVFSGHTAEEIIAKDYISFVDPSDKNSFDDFEQGRSGEVPLPKRCEFRLITKSGERKVAMFFSTPVMLSGETATMIHLVDISEKQRLEDKIQFDNIQRRGIIVTVAHELRTPLQPILGYLNLLIQDPEGFGILDDTKKILERCLASVDRERQIINQMLELSVLDSGKLHLNYSKFPLAMLINSVLDSSGYGGKAEISIDIPKNLVINADMDRLFGVFDSLLSNAVNFSQPPRKITVCYRSDTDDTFHHISVKDNGSGISENALSSIFEPFQLADAAKLSRRFDRIGLSLSMAKKIMQMHGGDITVESILHTGSTFTLHLPKSVQNSQ